jgi:predicted ATPase
LFPPWKGIFENDPERDQTFAHAVRVYKPLVEWYLACGYQIVEVPCMSVGERCRFVLRTLDATTGG